MTELTHLPFRKLSSIARGSAIFVMSLLLIFTADSPSSAETPNVSRASSSSPKERDSSGKGMKNAKSSLKSPEHNLITLIDAFERVTGFRLCEQDDLTKTEGQIACAKKQMEWASQKISEKETQLKSEQGEKILKSYFSWCYASCTKQDSCEEKTWIRCLAICCPYREQMIEKGGTNPFFNCTKNHYDPKPEDYNPCIEMK